MPGSFSESNNIFDFTKSQSIRFGTAQSAVLYPWLIILRALAAWRSRDWSLSEYAPIALGDQVSGIGITVEREILYLLETFNRLSPVDPFILFLAYFLRAHCLFERDKCKLAMRDCNRFMVHLNDCVQTRATTHEPNTIRIELSHDISVRDIQLMVFENIYPIARSQTTDNESALLKILDGTLRSFIDLVEKSVAALDSESTNMEFYSPLTSTDSTIAHPEWGRVLFRLIPCEPFPSMSISIRNPLITVHLAIVNEMNLFPHYFVGPDTRIPVAVEVVGAEGAVACTPTPPETSDLYYPGLDFHGFYGSGKGAVTFSLDCSKIQKDIYFRIFALNDTTSQTIIPLILGPFTVTHDQPLSLPSTDLIHTYRPVYLDRNDYITIQESTSDMAGKVWDSAFWTGEAAYRYIEKMLPCSLNILDLSSGNGAIGTFLYRKLFKSPKADMDTIKITLTDVEEALPLIKTNVDRLTIDTTQPISVKSYYWGDRQSLLSFEPFDVVIACDLIYENDLFDDLFITLTNICVPEKTQIFVGYKHRGLSVDEERILWEKLTSVFLIEEQTLQESTISGLPGLWNTTIGVRVWKMWRTNPAK